MTILACLDSFNGQITRYDTTRDEGLTHVGFLRGAEHVGAAVESFRLNPPEELRSAVYLAAMDAEIATQFRIQELVRELASLGVTDMKLVPPASGSGSAALPAPGPAAA